jgi:hypothetical protein
MRVGHKGKGHPVVQDHHGPLDSVPHPVNHLKATTMNEHPDDKQLSEYYTTDEPNPALDTHLRECIYCYEQYKQIQDAIWDEIVHQIR